MKPKGTLIIARDALIDAALMLERTYCKGGVTDLGAENCRKALKKLDALIASVPEYDSLADVCETAKLLSEAVEVGE